MNPNLMKYAVSAGVGLMLAGAAGCESYHHHHYVETGVAVETPAPEPDEVVVQESPPPDYVEEIPAPPGPDFIWVGGEWNYDRDHRHYVWQRGHYEDRRAHHGQRYTRGRWEHTDHGYVRRPGHWG